MRIADFILANIEPILAEWETFARSIWTGPPTDPAELRDHAADILRAAAHDMQSAQTPAEQAAKSKGKLDVGEKHAPIAKASGLHAVARVGAGFELVTVVAEYRALRASVIRLWRRSAPRSDLHDLDDLTRFNETIDQSIADAVHSYTKRAARSRQMFLAIVAHDLRNPLSAMKLTGQMLAHSGQLDTTLSDMATQMTVTADAMSRLIDDLLDFSGAELAGALPVAPAPMDLGDLSQQVVAELRAAHPNRPVRFHQSGDLAGEWDEARLRQVLSNLLGNAVQHGQYPNSAPGLIELQVIGEGPNVELAVRNEGPPIPHDALATIFDPLVRGEQAAHRPGSMGLGLYITRAAVLAHGGTIKVNSSEQSGTTFTVRLPRRHVQPARHTNG